MTSLKQEMREMFERHSSMALYERNSEFEDGLLEKIINLAYASLAPYSPKQWKIAAVRSPVMLLRLSKVAGDNRIADCAVALVIGSDTAGEDIPFKLFSLSVGYAAKYYCVDHFILPAVKTEEIKREWPAIPQIPAGIIGLGCFRNGSSTCPALQRQNYYTSSVTIIE